MLYAKFDIRYQIGTLSEKRQMPKKKLKRLKAAGWKVESAKDFLGLDEQEAALVEVKLSLM